MLVAGRRQRAYFLRWVFLAIVILQIAWRVLISLLFERDRPARGLGGADRRRRVPESARIGLVPADARRGAVYVLRAVRRVLGAAGGQRRGMGHAGRSVQSMARRRPGPRRTVEPAGGVHA